MTTLIVPSTSRESVEHTLYVHNNKAVGCTCESRQHSIAKACRHMAHYNREAVSCAICGAWTYKADGVCGKCYD